MEFDDRTGRRNVLKKIGGTAAGAAGLSGMVGTASAAETIRIYFRRHESVDEKLNSLQISRAETDIQEAADQLEAFFQTHLGLDVQVYNYFDGVTRTGALGSDEHISKSRVRSIVPDYPQQENRYNLLIVANGYYRLGQSLAPYDDANGGIGYANLRQNYEATDWFDGAAFVPQGWRINMPNHEVLHGFIDDSGNEHRFGEIEGWRNHRPSVMATGYVFSHGDNTPPGSTCTGDWNETNKPDPKGMFSGCTSMSVFRNVEGNWQSFGDFYASDHT